MKYDKNWITWFNKNKTKKLYSEVLKNISPEHKLYKICKGPVCYYNSTFRINKSNKINPINKSYLSVKNVYDKNYYLNICEDCLIEKLKN